MKIIYIASPYSHTDVAVRIERYRRAAQYAANLMLQGVQCFSPIAYGHQFNMIYGLPPDFKYWQDFNDRILLACDEVLVLKLDGYLESRGVQHEIKLADDNGIPVRYAQI